jgi:ABC-type transporter Mla subunit MlaD
VGNVDARKSARRALTAGVVLLLIVLVASSGNSELVIFGGGPSYDHTLQLTVPSAFEVIKGERVTEGGVDAGSIVSTNVTPQAQAHIVLGIQDSAWPVPTDSVLTLRMGGTIKFTDRFIEIAKGHANSTFDDGGQIPAAHFVDPVEYDALFNIFNKQTRTGLKQFFDNSGPTLQNAAAPLNQALGVSAPALGQASAIFGDLSYDQTALHTLVDSTAELTGAIQASNPGVRTLLAGAANTFGAVAAQSTQLQSLLDSATPAFKSDARTFRHAAADLPRIAALADQLSPGATELDRIAGPLASTLRYVVQVEPLATHTLQTVQQNGPSIDNLLATTRNTLFPELTSIGNQAATELDCIRPFSPEIVQTIQGWAGWMSLGLNNPHVHMLHGEASVLPFPNTMPINTQQIEQLFPNLHESLPSAPGEGWNQPWYQPQCGITAAGSNPANDPESGTYDPNGSKIVPYPSK